MALISIIGTALNALGLLSPIINHFKPKIIYVREDTLLDESWYQQMDELGEFNWAPSHEEYILGKEGYSIYKRIQFGFKIVLEYHIKEVPEDLILYYKSYPTPSMFSKIINRFKK